MHGVFAAHDVARVRVWRDHDDRVCAYGDVSNGLYCMQFPGLASYYFDNDGHDIQVVVEPLAPPDVVWDTYWRTVLPIALQLRGWEVLHASAVRTPLGVVAFCAPAETGKSTLAYGLSCRGYSLWTDDALVFETSRQQVYALALPFKIRLRTSVASYFEHDVTARDTPLNLHNAYPIGETEAPLVAVCVLKQQRNGEGPIEASLFSPSQALPEVLANSQYFSLHDEARTRRMMQQYLALVARVPIIDVRFPSGLDWLETILDTIEQTVDMVSK